MFLSLLALQLTHLIIGEVRRSNRLPAGDESEEAMAEVYTQAEKRYREVMGDASKFDPRGVLLGRLPERLVGMPYAAIHGLTLLGSEAS
jgi:hypothetical protein